MTAISSLNGMTQIQPAELKLHWRTPYNDWVNTNPLIYIVLVNGASPYDKFQAVPHSTTTGVGIYVSIPPETTRLCSISHQQNLHRGM